MSLDVSLVYGTEENPVKAFSANITHNLGEMAAKAGIYMPVWRPEEIDSTHALHLIRPLRDGLAHIKSDPKFFKTFDSPNYWGTYEQFVPWLEKYLDACETYPDATIWVSR